MRNYVMPVTPVDGMVEMNICVRSNSQVVFKGNASIFGHHFSSYKCIKFFILKAAILLPNACYLLSSSSKESAQPVWLIHPLKAHMQIITTSSDFPATKYL